MESGIVVSILVRLAWVSLIVGAFALLWRGLWMVTYFEPTGEALAEAWRGQLVVLLAALLLVAAAAAGYFWLGSPVWVAVLLVVPAVVCFGATTFDILAPITLALAYPCGVVALVGGLLLRR